MLSERSVGVSPFVPFRKLLFKYLLTGTSCFGKKYGKDFSLYKRPKFDQEQFSDMIGWDVFGWLISCGEQSSDMQRIDSRAVHSLKCFDDLNWNHYQPRRVNFLIKCIARDGISKQGNGKSLVPSMHFWSFIKKLLYPEALECIYVRVIGLFPQVIVSYTYTLTCKE